MPERLKLSVAVCMICTVVVLSCEVSLHVMEGGIESRDYSPTVLRWLTNVEAFREGLVSFSFLFVVLLSGREVRASAAELIILNSNVLSG